MKVRTRTTARDLRAGDELVATGKPVSRVIPTRKGDKVQIYAGTPTPKVVGNDEVLWVMRGPVTQAPSA